MQKVRCHPVYKTHKTPTACKLLISGSISLPFSGFFSPFPRGTCSLSVRTTYLEIRGWYPGVRWMITSPTDFQSFHSLGFTGLTPSLASVSSDFKPFLWKRISYLAFARHYLRNLFWFLFLKLLRCFSSLGSSLWGFPLLDSCISPFPPYSFRFSRPFAFDLGIHEKPFHFFYNGCMGALHTCFLFAQYLVAYEASFLGSECC